MPRFPSEEWMDSFCERLREQPGAEQLAATLEGVYRFVVDAGGPLQQACSYDIEIRPAEASAVHAARLEAGAGEPRLVLAASYDRWKQLIEGRLDVAMALMLRRLRVSGDLSTLMRDVGSAKPLLQALGEVDTVWLDG